MLQVLELMILCQSFGVQRVLLKWTLREGVVPERDKNRTRICL